MCQTSIRRPRGDTTDHRSQIFSGKPRTAASQDAPKSRKNERIRAMIAEGS